MALVERRHADSQPDIVEDSEPEREERRKQKEKDRRLETSPPAQGVDLADGCIHATECRPLDNGNGAIPVHPISMPSARHDDNQLLSERENSQHQGASGVVDDSSERVLFAANPYTIPQQASSLAKHIHDSRRSCPSPPPITTIEEYLVCEQNEEDELSCMRLSRFAYKPSSSHHNQLPQDSPHPTNSIPRIEPSFSLSKTGAEPKRTSSPSDAQISKLSKCVCCDLQWTAKKTGRQKRIHLEQCAKKHSVAQDALVSLINRQTSTTPQSELPSDVPSEARNENATLMHAIVSADTGKRSKRKLVTSTVKSVPETRESILSRARDILGPSAQFRSRELGAHTGDSRTVPDGIQPTQQFRTSIFARQNTGSVVSSYGRETDTDAPPSTQAFSESALSRRGMTSERMFGAYYEACSSSWQSEHTTPFTHKRPSSPSSNDTRIARPRLTQGK